MDLQHRVDAAIDAALGDRIVGCVVLVRRAGELVYARAAGLADREAGRAMTRDAIFRLASVTKPIVAAAALRMVDAGLLGLDDPVTRTLPWFTPVAPDGSTPVITIRQLLSHSSGVTYNVPVNVASGLSGPNLTLEENLRRLSQMPLAFQPGAGWAYGMGLDVIGGVIAEINGSDLEGAVARYVTEPLGMRDTHFYVADASRLAQPYADGRPPRRMGEPERVVDAEGGFVTFSPARIFNRDAPQSGGAGMAGVADDVMTLLESFQSGGLLEPATAAAALANQIGDIPRRPGDAGKGFGLIGAVLRDATLARSPCPAGAVDWGGVYGHNWLLDPVNRLSAVVLTNTAFEGCNGPFREEVRNAIYA